MAAEVLRRQNEGG